MTACARAQIRVLGDEGGKDVEGACDDAFLKKIEATMLTQARAWPARPPARLPANALAAQAFFIYVDPASTSLQAAMFRAGAPWVLARQAPGRKLMQVIQTVSDTHHLVAERHSK